MGVLRQWSANLVAGLLVIGCWLTFPAARAAAQEPVAPTGEGSAPPPPASEQPAPAATAVTPPPELPPAPSPPVPAPAPVVAPAPSPQQPAPPPPPTPAQDPKAFSAGAWLRVGGRIQNPSEPNKLNDVWLNELYLIAAFRGQITDWLKWQINLNANVPPSTAGTPDPMNPGATLNPSVSGPPASYPAVGVQDVIAKIEPDEAFNVWLGRMIVPFDRANLSGPWFINYWAFPGFFGNRAGPPVGAKANANGRDGGATVWGQVGKGRFKYYLGAFNLNNPQAKVNPLATGRVSVALLDPEPGYYNQSAYHGEKDIVSLGAGFQYQKDGVVSAADGLGNVTNLEAELLVDKKLGEAGVGTFEASAYFFDKRQPIRQFYVLGAGYVIPQDLGPGRLCPAIRYQFTHDTELHQLDGYLAYLVKSHFAKFTAGFFYADYPNPMPGGPKLKSKGIQLGVQLVKF